MAIDRRPPSSFPNSSLPRLTFIVGWLRYAVSYQAPLRNWKSLPPTRRGAAVVGAEGLRGVLLTSVRVAPGREIELFSTTEEAEEWLASR